MTTHSNTIDKLSGMVLGEKIGFPKALRGIMKRCGEWEEGTGTNHALPDYFSTVGNELIAFEVVCTSDITRHKAEVYYWLKDILEGCNDDRGWGGLTVIRVTDVGGVLAGHELRISEYGNVKEDRGRPVHSEDYTPVDLNYISECINSGIYPEGIGAW